MDFDLARRDARVLTARRAALDLAVDFDDVLVVQGGGDFERRGRRRWIDDHLDQPGAVAQVDEDQPAVVAHGVHPALEDDGLADVFGADFAAHHGTFHGIGQKLTECRYQVRG